MRRPWPLCPPGSFVFACVSGMTCVYPSRMLSPTAPPPESVFERLLSEGAATTEDVRQMKHILSLLDDAGALGMPPAQLLVSDGGGYRTAGGG